MLIFDPAAVKRFILIGRPTPVTDFSTKAPVTGTDGKQLYRYPVLLVREAGRPVQIAVKAPEAAGRVEEGSAVVLRGLVGVLWERDGKQAVAFRADAIAPPPEGGK